MGRLGSRRMDRSIVVDAPPGLSTLRTALVRVGWISGRTSTISCRRYRAKTSHNTLLRAKRGNLQISSDTQSEMDGLPRRCAPRNDDNRYRCDVFKLLFSLLFISWISPASAETGLVEHWNNLWRTPEQQAERAFQQGDYLTAAGQSHEPMRIGSAYYRAAEFEQAASAFARVNSTDGIYNQGTALLMHGQYDAAIAAFDRVLEIQPDWEAAQQNRGIAQARKERLEFEGERPGATEIGADDMVFDRNAQNQENQDEIEVESSKGLSDQELRALWLRKSQTSPAVFLKAKFAAQLAIENEAETQ